MHKITLLSIAVLALLAGAAIAQTPEPEPAWRASALAMVPAGYVAGEAYRTDEAGQTGYLAVYPANASDPKSPASVFAPRQALVVRLEGATPPGKDYEDEKKYPRNAPKPYAGRGWVAANKIGASYANGGTRMGGLFQAPFTDAKWTQAARKLGGTLDTDGGPKRILACSGYWGLVESHDGVRGWWRSLCSNQVTNCS